VAQINLITRSFVDGELWDSTDVAEIVSKTNEIVESNNAVDNEITTARDGETDLHTRINRDVGVVSQYSIYAAASAAAAAQSEANAAQSEANAAQSATNASNSASAAATSASNAAQSATNVATYRDDSYKWANESEDIQYTDSANRTGYSSYHYSKKAEASANAASVSETNAAQSAANAAQSESNAATSASNASQSASNAATSETNAAASAAAALNYLNTFKGIYYGSYASDPSTDPNGNTPNEGDFYWNSTNNILKVYDGSVWINTPTTQEVYAYSDLASFPATGKTNTIYIDTSTNTLYRWDTTSNTYKKVSEVNASNILEELKTVDGSGSGLDADLLDGLDSSSFVKTTDYKDADVLAKIKNVDGVGSGLDADLVRGLPADFTCSKTTNGYTKLPNGLIIQWVYYEQSNPLYSDSVYTFTFPIAFPNAVVSCFGICYPGNTNGLTYDYGITIDSNSLTTSQVKIRVWDRGGSTNSNGPGKIWVCVIGY